MGFGEGTAGTGRGPGEPGGRTIDAAGWRTGSGEWITGPGGRAVNTSAGNSAGGVPARPELRHRAEPSPVRRGHRQPRGSGPAPSRTGPRTRAPAAPARRRGPYQAVLGWMAIWYTVPVALYLGWALTRATTPDPNCQGAVGTTCPSPRAEALHGLLMSVPDLGLAIALSLALAVAIRMANAAWPAAIVSMVGAVVGGGITTVIAPWLFG